jgi:SAM-dependent methyltransferase
MPTALQKALYRPLQVVHSRLCPLCGWHGFTFLRFGNNKLPREDAQCRWCRAVERHRAAYVIMNDDLEQAAAAGPLRVLHVAPETCLQPWLQRLVADSGPGGRYLSIDLDPRKAMQQEDLRALTLADDAWDLVWCSHVLEHVDRDDLALREMRRILAPGGRVVLQVPIIGEYTYEDAAVTERQARLNHFLQEDHVRVYGLDIEDRLRGAGFRVDVRRVSELDPTLVRKHALQFRTTNEVFVCRK